MTTSPARPRHSSGLDPVRSIIFDGRSVSAGSAPRGPTPPPGEALIRPLKVAVSSTERALLAHAKLTGQSETVAPFVGVMGHEFIGVVEDVCPKAGRDEQRQWIGKRVVGGINDPCGRCDLCRGGLSAHCRARTVLGLLGRDGCFSDRFCLPTANLVEVPASVDDDRAVFAGPLAAVAHIAHAVRLQGKPYVTVLGDGTMGLLAAQVMVRMNASVRLLGKHPEKFTLCERWSIRHRHIDEVGRRNDQDVVIDCTGEPGGVELALGLVRPRGKIVVKGAPVLWPGAARAWPDLSAVSAMELEVIGSRSARMADAVDLLARGMIDVLPLITGRGKLGDAPRAIEGMSQPEAIKFVLDV
ncbi:MAG: alcohol dehydrogenase catalytic domain-containing protein [Planctomycetota bacterium]|nr:alcohol dehydrogenase catalytic domain-containing protein [Planctomycetota bacterium]